MSTNQSEHMKALVPNGTNIDSDCREHMCICNKDMECQCPKLPHHPCPRPPHPPCPHPDDHCKE